MKFFFQSSLILLCIFLCSQNAWATIRLNFDSNGDGLYEASYTNSQTAYFSCTVQGRINITTSIDGENTRFITNDWNVSSNFTLITTPIQNIIGINLDPNRNDGSVSVNVGGTLITVNITQKTTPSLTISPTLCSPGQSGDFSTTLNFYDPTPANVVWETTGGITVNGGSSYRVNDNTISRATIQQNSYGTLTVYGEIPGCNNMRTKSVIQHIGTPSGNDLELTSFPVIDGISICSGGYYNIRPTKEFPPSQYGFNWSIPSGENNFSLFQSAANCSLTVNAGSGGGILLFTITNLACNTSGNTSQTLQIINCNSSFRVASNPTSDKVTAVFDQIDDTKYLPVSIRLSHEKNGVIKEVKVREKYSKENAKHGLRIDVDVKNLPKDTYYLQGIYDDGKIQSERIVVQ